MDQRNEPCLSLLFYKGTILHRNYWKMTIPWSFSINSFVKFYGKKKHWEPHDHVISIYFFDSILYVTVNNFSIMSGQASWVELILSKD